MISPMSLRGGSERSRSASLSLPRVPLKSWVDPGENRDAISRFCDGGKPRIQGLKLITALLCSNPEGGKTGDRIR